MTYHHVGSWSKEMMLSMLNSAQNIGYVRVPPDHVIRLVSHTTTSALFEEIRMKKNMGQLSYLVTMNLRGIDYGRCLCESSGGSKA